jgi:hypothetical protein
MKFQQQVVEGLRDTQQQGFETVMSGVQESCDKLMKSADKQMNASQKNLQNSFEKIIMQVDSSNETSTKEIQSHVDYMVKSVSTWTQSAASDLNDLIKASAEETTKIQGNSQALNHSLLALQSIVEKLDEMNKSLVPAFSDLGSAARSLSDSNFALKSSSEVFTDALVDFKEAFSEQKPLLKLIQQQAKHLEASLSQPVAIALVKGADEKVNDGSISGDAN